MKICKLVRRDGFEKHVILPMPLPPYYEMAELQPIRSLFVESPDVMNHPAVRRITFERDYDAEENFPIYRQID